MIPLGVSGEDAPSVNPESTRLTKLLIICCYRSVAKYCNYTETRTYI